MVRLALGLERGARRARGERSLSGARAIIAAAMGLALTDCGSSSSQAERTASVAQPIVAGLADPDIKAPNQVVNRYTALAADAVKGATTIAVANAAALNASAGDLLFVLQMQGAQVDGTESPTFGTVTNLDGAGNFEMVTVQGVAGNLITLAAGCGLVNGYAAAAHTQVVWVPQYAALTVEDGGSITAPSWNGATGGVVVIQAGSVDLNGLIDVAGLGFRGGALSNFANDPVTPRFVFRSTDALTGAEKGESIAGFEADYDAPAIGGRYSLGAIANGGGGGASHNGGGGGGANGDNGNPWAGSGFMPNARTNAGAWDTAWALDPDDITAGGPTQSSGGGRGGYSYSANAEDPLVVGPDNALWGGDWRQYRGGLGGHPLASDPRAHLYAGGGGGAGNENNANGGAGGAGGGIVVLVAGAVTGSGGIHADGAPGHDTTAPGRDAAGGGGGGGSIVIAAASVADTLAVTATGGAGGHQVITGFADEAEGPGAGGGGGWIALPAGATTATVSGGIGGTTDSPTMTAFACDGATDGAPGLLSNLTPDTTPPMCIAADLAVTMVDGGGTIAPGTSVTYTIVVTNLGPNPATGASLGDSLGGDFAGDTWTCAGAACPAAAGTGNLSATLGTLRAGASVTFAVTAGVSPNATGTLSNTATVSPPAGITDGDPGNDSVTVTNPLAAPSALVSAALTNDPAVVDVGSPCDYTLTLTNAGPDSTLGVMTTIVLPAGAGAGPITAAGWTCGTPAGDTVICTLPNLAPSAQTTIRWNATAPMTPGPSHATATATATIGGTVTASDAVDVLCTTDTQCGTGWCTAAGSCDAKAANGLPVPTPATVNGVCTAQNGARACLSGVCDPNGNICGIAVGDGPCASTLECVAGICAMGGTCVVPSVDGGEADGGPIDGGQTDSDALDVEVPGDEGVSGDAAAADAGAEGGPHDSGAATNEGGADAATDSGPPPEAGASDAARSDAAAEASPVDSASAGETGDASASDAEESPIGAEGGVLEGGGCSCETAGGSGRSSAPAGLLAFCSLLGILVHRRRMPNESGAGDERESSEPSETAGAKER